MKGVAICLAAGVAVTLQGCGGGSTTTQPGPTPPPTTTPAPGPPAPAPDPTPTGPDGQYNGADAAEYLNNHYMDYDPDNDASHMGVAINFRGDDKFQFFCSVNGTTCYLGKADCRTSAALMNKRLMITEQDTMKTFSAQKVGIAFNMSSVERQLHKCSYVYDGATDRKLNMGCGCGSLGTDSCDVVSAFDNNDCALANPWNSFVTQDCMNACYNDESTCIKAAPGTQNVEPCYCSSTDLEDKWPDYNMNSTIQGQCYFKAKNFYTGVNGTGTETSTDETRDMLKRRMTSQVTPTAFEDAGEETPRYKPEYWNEIVLDGFRIFQMLDGDFPAHLVVAIVYDKQDAVAPESAQRMANEMKENYNMQQPVPIIAYDLTVNVTTTGPFEFQGSAAETVTV